MTSRDERLRALVQSWREIADKHDARAERLNESGDASAAAWCEAAAEHRSYCADELASLIAELGQEVGAEQIGWVREVTWVDGRNMTIYENEPKPLVNPMAGFVSQRIVPVFTSTAHTSEARDAAWSGAVFERGYSAGYRAALGAASAECRRIGEALDGGGNTYVRYEDAIKCAVSVGRLSIPAIDLETFDPAWVVAALKWVATDESTCKLSRREAKEQARLICAMYNLPIDAAMRQEAGSRE